MPRWFAAATDCTTCGQLRAELALAHGALAIERGRYDNLMADYKALVQQTLDLKRDGFALPMKAADPEPSATEVPDRILSAIKQRTPDPRSPAYASNYDYAVAQLAVRGADAAAEIASEILDGDDVEALL